MHFPTIFTYMYSEKLCYLAVLLLAGTHAKEASKGTSLPAR